MKKLEAYGWQSTKPAQSVAYIVPEIKRILAPLGVHRLADLGCGNGGVTGELAACGFDVVGIEQDGEGVDLARRAHPEAKFYRYGVQDDPQDLLQYEKPFDVVVSTEVIEHLYAPHLLLEFAQRILKDDGFLLVSTPYHGYLKNVALSALNKWDAHHTALWHGGHIKFWSRKTLGKLFEQNRFHVEGFRGVGRAPYLWKSMIMLGRKV